jgi:hypothetical protein
MPNVRPTKAEKNERRDRIQHWTAFFVQQNMTLVAVKA